MLRRTFVALASLPVAFGVPRRALAATPNEAREQYADALASLAEKRKQLAAQHAKAADEAARRRVITSARRELLAAFDRQLMPAWQGTAWDYNGTTQKPGEGTIACGYFVSTVVRDLGFRVERARLAQQPSERIAKTLCPAEAIWRFRRGDVDAVVDSVTEKGAGLYVVGLDNHVGFLRTRAKATTFCHASYVDPQQVTREDPRKADAFASSYHVVGRLFSSVMVTRWLRSEAIATLTES